MQSTTIRRASFLTVCGVFLFFSGALFGRSAPSSGAASCPVPSGSGRAPNDRVRSIGARSADAEGSETVFVAGAPEHAPTCQSVLFEEENGGGVSLDYDGFDAIAWNPSKTVLVVEHALYHVVIDGAHVDLLRDRFLKRACGSIAATQLPPAGDSASGALDGAGAPNEPYIARVRVVLPDAYHWGKQGEYVSGEESP